MMETVLQTYLNNQFIKTTEEGNVANLKKAVTEVVKLLKRKKSKIVNYTLVAIDPLISEYDPVVVEVEKIIIKKWPAFKNNVTATKDKATTYIRAVILDSLSKIAKEDFKAPIIWLSSKNLIQYYKIGNEREVISTLFQEFAKETEKQGQDLWSLSTQIKMPTISIPNISVEGKVISKNHLTKRLHAAAGPTRTVQNVNTENDEPRNTRFPNQNQHWVSEFGVIAADAISSSVNTVLKEQNNTLKGISDQINMSLKGLEPYFKNIREIFTESANASNKRGQLLWWKEALYSPILGRSYRVLSPIGSAIVMAIDLSNMIPTVYPESVEYLLRESLKAVHGEDVDNEQSLTDLVDEISKISNEEKGLLQKLSIDLEGRKPLFNTIANSLSDGSVDDSLNETGIEKEANSTLADFSVWLFNDLQVQKLVSIK